MKTRTMSFGLLAGMFCAIAIQAADYPTFRGPARDGHSPETGLLQEWPAEGPTLLWAAEGVGRGFSQPLYVNGVVYITGDIGNDLALSAINAESGEFIWHQILPGGAWTGHIEGSRGTPTYDLASNRIYVLTPQGVLSARDATNKGEEVWSRNLKSDWGGNVGGWACS